MPAYVFACSLHFLLPSLQCDFALCYIFRVVISMLPFINPHGEICPLCLIHPNYLGSVCSHGAWRPSVVLRPATWSRTMAQL